MRLCVDVADSVRMPTFLISATAVHAFYYGFGFKELTHFDIDLGKFGIPYQGYGVYRCIGMLRE